MQEHLFDCGITMTRTAEFSPCMLYRYALTRAWEPLLPACTFVMLNPSIADASADDPTIRRCIGFAKRFQYGKLYVVNLFALISPNPDRLRENSYPVSEPDDPTRNDETIKAHVRNSAVTVVAWGADPRAEYRSREVYKQIQGLVGSHNIVCLGITKKGAPKHPLYLRRAAKLIPWFPGRVDR